MEKEQETQTAHKNAHEYAWLMKDQTTLTQMEFVKEKKIKNVTEPAQLMMKNQTSFDPDVFFPSKKIILLTMMR